MPETSAIENPNDKMPPGVPLGHNEIASDDGDDLPKQNGSVATEVESAVAQELPDGDNDLVNVAKFTDPASEVL